MTVYTPTVWHTNDLITSEKLNKIENRIEELYNIKVNFTILPTYNEVKTLLDLGIFPTYNGQTIYATGEGNTSSIGDFYLYYWDMSYIDNSGAAFTDPDDISTFIYPNDLYDIIDDDNGGGDI